MKKTFITFLLVLFCMVSFCQTDTIYAEHPDKIRISNLTIEPAEPHAGDTVNFYIEVEIQGDSSDIWINSDLFSFGSNNVDDIAEYYVEKRIEIREEDSTGKTYHYDTLSTIVDEYTNWSFEYKIYGHYNAGFFKSFELKNYRVHPFEKIDLILVDTSECDSVMPFVYYNLHYKKRCDSLNIRKMDMLTITENINDTLARVKQILSFYNFPKTFCEKDTALFSAGSFSIINKTYTYVLGIKFTDIIDSITFKVPEIRNDCDEDTITTTSIFSNNNYLSNIKIYPNPANTDIIIESEIPTSAYFELYNLSGIKVLQQKIIANRQIINLSACPKGMYIYKILNNSNQSEYGKLTIKR